MPGFVLLVRPRGDGEEAMRIGLTVSKKVGGAVVRNRMKRRLRELVRAVLPDHGVAGADHVLIGRAQGVERDFALLRGELVKALSKLKSKTVRPEPVEGRPFSSPAHQEKGELRQPRIRSGAKRSEETSGGGSPR